MVMAAGLPLDPIDCAVAPVMDHSLPDQALDRLAVCSGEILVGDKPSSAGERRQPQRAEAGDR